MECIPAKEKFSADPNQPIAVVYGWLLAKSRHLEKFGHFYNDYGADVVTVKPNVSEVNIFISRFQLITAIKASNESELRR